MVGNATQLDRLGEYSHKELKLLYQTLYQGFLPARVSESFLRAQIAWMLQGNEKSLAIDEFHQAVIEKLEKVGKPSATVAAGTRLMREWHGNLHQVEVRASGYEYKGKNYRSLSEIAGLITGTKWSGPRFFGLKVKPHG